LDFSRIFRAGPFLIFRQTVKTNRVLFISFDEEQLLRQQLPGYTQYCQRTPFRLIPLIW